MHIGTAEKSWCQAGIVLRHLHDQVVVITLHGLHDLDKGRTGSDFGGNDASCIRMRLHERVQGLRRCSLNCAFRSMP